MKQNKNALCRFALPLLGVMAACTTAACTTAGATDKDPLPPDEMAFTVVFSEAPLDHEDVFVDIASRQIRAFTNRGTSVRRELSVDEYDEMLALSTDARVQVFREDTQREEQSDPAGPNCDPPQEAAVMQICSALEIARIHVSASLYIKGDNAADPVRNAAFAFDRPTSLSRETAEMILFLETMRLRNHEEGEPK